VPAPTVATPGVPLVQVPPPVVLVHVAVPPIHNGVVPEMVCAIGAVIVTVFVAVFVQPPVTTEYVINDVPAAIPVTKPEPASTVATPGVALVHVPPAVVLVQVAVPPIHNGVVPEMVCATGAVTVTVFVAVFVQPPVTTE